MTTTDGLDLDAYLERIGHREPVAPDLETLEWLHAAHLAAIPFENLDVRLGRPVGLDLPSLQDKLVRRRRGGYCFEQNTLFAAVLRTIGFEVETLEARVRPPDAPGPLPRTHMTLRVEAAGRSWLADVGFGGNGPGRPVPLDGGESEETFGVYAVAPEAGGVHALRHRADGAWRDLYAFTLAPALPIDFEVAHHFTSTHPRSPFVNTLTVQRSTPHLRQVLRGRSYAERVIREGEEIETARELGDREAARLVTGTLGLDVSEADVVRALPS